MDNLIVACTDSLDQPAIPSCPTDYGERVIAFALMKEGGTFEVSSSDNPSAAEFVTAIAASEVTFYSGVTNGHRVEQGSTELSGDDTISGGTERYDVEYRVEGRLKLFDEVVKRATEKMDRFSTLRLWFFTEKNYVFGGGGGYYVSPNFSEQIFEGKGNPPYIPFFFDYVATGADYSNYDADFADLSN